MALDILSPYCPAGFEGAQPLARLPVDLGEGHAEEPCSNPHLNDAAGWRRAPATFCWCRSRIKYRFILIKVDNAAIKLYYVHT